MRSDFLRLCFSHLPSPLTLSRDGLTLSLMTILYNYELKLPKKETGLCLFVSSPSDLPQMG